MGMTATGGDVDSMAYLTNGVALPCIFNRQRGAVFTTYAYTQVGAGAHHGLQVEVTMHAPAYVLASDSTRNGLWRLYKVSYHQRNPQLNDEIKIRLPDVITPAHHLVFR